jgi:hypothetical protein
MFHHALSDKRAMMRDVFDRFILAVAAIATAMIGSASLANADPECPSGSCTHGASHSPSYQNGYSSEHDFYSIPKNHEYLKNEMRQDGYNAGLVCQVELNGGPQPSSVTDWLSGCVDALHDLGFKP